MTSLADRIGATMKRDTDFYATHETTGPRVFIRGGHRAMPVSVVAEQQSYDGSGWRYVEGERKHLAAGPLAAARSAIKHELRRIENGTTRSPEARVQNLRAALHALESAEVCGDFVPWIIETWESGGMVRSSKDASV